MPGPKGKRNGMWKNGAAIAGDKNGMRRKPEARPRGSKNGMAMLNDNIVARLRKMSLRTTESYRFFAKTWGVDESTIRRMMQRKTWRHVKP
jgi:hypothetical protein